MRYSADIIAGSLKVSESRIIADLLLRGTDKQGWQTAIMDRNLLQARTTETARRLARLIRGRQETIDADLWRLVRDGTGTVVTHAVLAPAVKRKPAELVASTYLETEDDMERFLKQLRERLAKATQAERIQIR